MLVAGTTFLLTAQSFVSPEEIKSSSFNTPFELTMNDKVFLPKAKKELSVSLLNINDNRCPENVNCITAGRAIAEIKLTSRNGSEAIAKLKLEQTENSSDTVSISLDEANYSIILNEVNRLFANRIKIVVKKVTT